MAIGHEAKARYWIAAALVVVAIGCGVAAAREWYWYDYRLGREGATAAGVAYDVTKDGRRTPAAYSFKVGFATPDGVERTLECVSPRVPSSPVAVRYLPSDPSVARIEPSGWRSYRAGAIGSVIAAALMTLWGYWHQRRG